jgi:hypothetical protein
LTLTGNGQQQLDFSLQRPSMTKTTIANHGRRRQKWPPCAPHETLRLAPKHQMDGRQPLKQVDIILGVLVEGVYGPLNAQMLWQCIITIMLEYFEGHTHPLNPPKSHLLSWGVVAHPFNAFAWRARPHVGCWAGGAFPPAAAMVVEVVMPAMFELRLQKNAIKTLKLVVCKQCLYSLLYFVKHEHIAFHVMLVVA